MWEKDEYQKITVARDNMWKDIKHYFMQVDYENLKLPITVEFKNESTIDNGGPRRELFRLALVSAVSDKSLRICWNFRVSYRYKKHQCRDG